MKRFSLSHLSDGTLDRGLESAARAESGATAWLLAHLAESEARRRHVPAGYPTMSDYCIRHLHFSEAAAYKRIRVARAARDFPVIFEMIADGRLHLTGALLLAPHLTTSNAAGLLESAKHRSRGEIERLLAERFPRADLPELIVALAPATPTAQEVHTPLAPGRVDMTGPEHVADPVPVPAVIPPLAAAPALAPGRITPAPYPKITPLAPERFAIQCTVGRRTHDHLRRAQQLLRHQVPDGNVAEVLDRALALLVRELEKRKCAATEHPRARTGRTSTNPRHIPAAVKRAVWKRDGGQCTFRSESGHRCEARDRLEFDHELPVARGGSSNTGNLRLRCRAHNQLEAERTYGAEFMKHRRASARTAPC